MFRPVLKRFQLGIARLSAGDILSYFHSGTSSYELLPTQSRPHDTMKPRSMRLGAMVLSLVFFLLVISGVSAGLVLRPSNSVGK